MYPFTPPPIHISGYAPVDHVTTEAKRQFHGLGNSIVYMVSLYINDLADHRTDTPVYR